VTTPSRPVAAASIETAWGQAIHDYTFAPSGCRSMGGAVSVTSSTPVTLPIDTATEDPGGYVDIVNNRLVIPADRAGLYAISARINSVTGATTTQTRVRIQVNGTSIGRATEDNDGGVNVQVPVTVFPTLAAGDIINVTAAKIGSGTSPSVSIEELTIVRLGDVLGA
jgi:hypothetical protein